MITRLNIGIDFDNTIAIYDEVIHQVAIKQNLIPASFPKNKTLIRDHIRSLPEGDIEWQKIQGQIYGPEIHLAQLVPDLLPFLKSLKKNQHQAFIVSHKTEFSNYDPSQTPLRLAALNWLKQNHIVDDLVPEQNVFFASTRLEKIQIIKQLKCDIFIDDLAEVFEEKDFPISTKKVLYTDPVQWKELHGAF